MAKATQEQIQRVRQWLWKNDTTEESWSYEHVKMMAQLVSDVERLVLKQINAVMFGGELAGPDERIIDGVIELGQRSKVELKKREDAAWDRGHAEATKNFASVADVASRVAPSGEDSVRLSNLRYKELFDELCEQVAQMCEFLGSKRDEVPCDSWHLRDKLIQVKPIIDDYYADRTPTKCCGNVPAMCNCGPFTR